MSTFIIAEAGVNHNGSFEMAAEMVRIAAGAGADAVKFQTFRADSLVAPGTSTADYQCRATGLSDQYQLLKSLELSEDAHRRLFRLCEQLGIEFMSTPFDDSSALFLVGLGIRRVKIPSGELTNLPFLRNLAKLRLPLILSTGMGSMDEVEAAIAAIRDAQSSAPTCRASDNSLTLLHCTSNYPAALADVNLRAMRSMATATGLPVGYSDHTLGADVALAAVAMGATMIEKHFTLDTGLPGPDHRASLDPTQLRDFIARVRRLEVALGSDVKLPAPSEIPMRELVRRSVTAARPIARGAIISFDDLSLLRPGHGIPPRDLERVVGCRAIRDLEPGRTLMWTDVEAVT